MKVPRTLLLSLVVPALGLLSTESEGAEKLRLSSGVEKAGRALRGDGPILRGKARRMSTLPPVERVRNNTNVARYEGRNTVPDYFSGPVIMFHLRNGEVVPGHAFDY
jgi:hypothetical protein